MHATAFLKSPEQVEVQPVTVIYGPQRYLQCALMAAIVHRVLGEANDAEFGPVRFDGKAVDPKTVFDELRTVSMWGDKRIVIVDDADEFVSRNRAGLEAYVELPARKSVLVLVVRSWPKNTKLAKKVDATGLALECADLSGAALIRWLNELCTDQYAKQLERNAAELLIERAGAELGLLSQEVEKLAAFVGNRERITSTDVDTLVGGWRTEATWAMVGALRDAKLGRALEHLDKLLAAGEAPQRILGGVQFVFRKLAQATEIAARGESLSSALSAAGVFPRDIDSSARYLRRIGRPRAEQLSAMLLAVDADMKGSSKLSYRVLLERLLVELGGVA